MSISLYLVLDICPVDDANGAAVMQEKHQLDLTIKNYFIVSYLIIFQTANRQIRQI